MVQTVVMFENDKDVLFAYWLSSQQDDHSRLIFFNLNTDIEEIMAQLH